MVRSFRRAPRVRWAVQMGGIQHGGKSSNAGKIRRERELEHGGYRSGTAGRSGASAAVEIGRGRGRCRVWRGKGFAKHGPDLRGVGVAVRWSFAVAVATTSAREGGHPSQLVTDGIFLPTWRSATATANPGEGDVPGQHFETAHSWRVQVRGRGYGFDRRLAPAKDSALFPGRARRRSSGLSLHLGDPEVSDLDPAIGAHQDIARFDVAVHDPAVWAAANAEHTWAVTLTATSGGSRPSSRSIWPRSSPSRNSITM